MSTQGSFIIRKSGIDKEQIILHDAYPDGIGYDVIDLIKTTNIHALYACMSDTREEDTDEECLFSAGRCKACVRSEEKMAARVQEKLFIQNSLFCEYAYVIDLDQEELLFYKGGQIKPQDGNRYGIKAVQTKGAPKPYYPCRLCAVFALDYVRLVKADAIIGKIKAAEKAETVTRWTLADIIEQELETDDFGEDKKAVCGYIRDIGSRLSAMVNLASSICVTNQKQIRELKYMCAEIAQMVDTLKERMEIMIPGKESEE
ncbi:MAG: hypothetical protein IJX90_11335 [Blautia sp.]|nr:hypothetical protein [Blautia sp.]